MAFFGRRRAQPRLEPDFVRTWTGGELGRIAAGVDLDTLRAVYGRLDATSRIHFLSDFGALFSDGHLFELWERRLLEPEDALERVVLAAVHLGAGHRERALILALEAGRDIVPLLVAQQAAAGAQEWRDLDPYHPVGLRLLVDRVDVVKQEELAADVAAHAPPGHLGHGVVPYIVMRGGVAEEYLVPAWRRFSTGPAPDLRQESEVLNLFLRCFHRAGQWEEARQVLQRLDGRVSASVWGSVDAFVEARDAILAGAGE
ncbi:hypothetical protein [Corynebacterium sp.]|uniref:hypothetical protein n=1 Tax=Corynebacterium sp. TaxID=1720 RepID=UPI00198B35D7|nr:hypothetical protein [Corynebacterium sp.]HHU67413.1 hypothetical protein [Corynebacterium sp.]